MKREGGANKRKLCCYQTNQVLHRRRLTSSARGELGARDGTRSSSCNTKPPALAMSRSPWQKDQRCTPCNAR